MCVVKSDPPTTSESSQGKIYIIVLVHVLKLRLRKIK